MPERDTHDPSTLVPAGRPVRIPGRGTTFVRDAPGIDGAPTVILLHGLGATAAINWPGAFRALSPRFRVLALDHRGHGRGIRTRRPLRLADCADDVVALVDVLGIDHFVAAGYSMGGPVALLARRRHPSRVAGLVLSATSARFVPDDIPAPLFTGAVAAALRVVPPPIRRSLAESTVRYLRRETTMPPAFLDELRRHDPAAIAEAARAVRFFDARPWIDQLDCPAASVVTEHDRLVPARRQLQLAHTTGATVHHVAGDHDVAVRHPARFLPSLAAACDSVIHQHRITSTGPAPDSSIRC